MEQVVYFPFVIYKNLETLFKYRQLELVYGHISVGRKKLENSSQFLDHDKFKDEIMYYGYVILEARDSKEKKRRFPPRSHVATHNFHTKTYFILTDFGSKYGQKSPELANLLGKIPRLSVEKRDYNIEIIIITENSMGTNLQKKIAEFTRPGGPEAGFNFIYHYNYDMFSCDKTQHQSVPKTRIISREEEIKVLDGMRCKKTDLPEMLRMDPIAVWIGAVPGDIVEEKHYSESSGITIIHRRII